jgi:hypothetical protein
LSVKRVLLAALAVAAMTGPAAAQAATPELSVDSELERRRYVASGDRAFVVGFENARYYAQGWHIRGEMGGFWAAPLKLLDGLWVGVDGQWAPPANRFTSGWGYVRMDHPATRGVRITRTEFAPDGRRAALVGLELENTEARRTVTVMVDAHAELIHNYPWDWTNPPARDFNLQDTGSFDGRSLVFREQGTPPTPNAERHDWAAVVRADREPSGGETGPGHFGPQEPEPTCQPGPAWQDPCKDSYNGKGWGGQLRYRVTLPAGGSRTLWLAVAGSERGAGRARAEARRALRDPEEQLEDKVADRRALGSWTRLSLAGNQRLVEGIDWSKQNLADSVQVAEDLDLRDVDEGRAYPPPLGRLDRARWLGAGWPDYPWLFGTDGEYTAFANVAVGQFETIMDHLQALREVSDIANERSGKVVHEVMHEGSIYFGMNRHAGNTDETAKFPSAVALLWRWTGDDRWLRQMYDFSRRNMEYIFRELDDDGDLWPEGLGNVERGGMGEEKLDNTVYTLRGLWDLADMADAMGDRSTEEWATERARAMEQRFEASWWMPEVPQYADSLDDPGNVKQLRRHWIGVTPMDVELLQPENWLVRPGLSAFANANQALDVRERPCYSSQAGMFHTGSAGCDNGPPSPSELDIFTLNTAIIAVGEGNYGRLALQKRYTDANVDLQLGPTIEGPTPDEQPGAMPERAPAPAYGTNRKKPYTERGMVLQAWGAYGTAWPVVRQQLGLRPDLGREQLTVVPQVPPTGPVEGENVRMGRGRDALREVTASRTGNTYRTTIHTGGVELDRLYLGHTLDRGQRPVRVLLDGRPVHEWTERETHRGNEVTVRTDEGRHELEIVAG